MQRALPDLRALPSARMLMVAVFLLALLVWNTAIWLFPGKPLIYAHHWVGTHSPTGFNFGFGLSRPFVHYRAGEQLRIMIDARLDHARMSVSFMRQWQIGEPVIAGPKDVAGKHISLSASGLTQHTFVVPRDGYYKLSVFITSDTGRFNCTEYSKPTPDCVPPAATYTLRLLRDN